MPREASRQGEEASSGPSPTRRPVKFSSMSDVREHQGGGQASLQTGGQASLPASSGSAGTMAPPCLSPQPLPPHLADLVVTRPRQQRTASRSSLTLSRNSAGNSIETVISVPRREERSEYEDTEEEVAAVRRSQEERGASDTPLSSYSEGPGLGERQRFLPPPPRQAWREEGARREVGEGERRSRGRRLAAQSSEPSSVPSTSDEEPRGGVRGQLGVRREAAEDTSTMESARLIDRAKSFEYIPGSSFPLQENSSSYEYLPGHLVPEHLPGHLVHAQHPGHLVQDQHPRHLVQAQHPGHLVQDQHPGHQHPGHQHPGHPPPADNRPPTVLTRRPRSAATTVDLPDSGNLEHVSAELKEKSRELLTANLQQTRQFFKKLKSYIDFLSTPSLSVEDCRVKQELAGRISSLLATEEGRLDSRQSGSSLHSAPPGAASLSLGSAKETLGDISQESTSSEQSSLRAASRLSDWRRETTRSEEQYGGRGREAEMARVLHQRVAHMRRIKKEMRKLEKLDSWMVSSGRGQMVESVSELSVQTTVSTVATDTRVSVSSREGGRERRGRGHRKENIAPVADRQNFAQMFPSDVEVSRIEQGARTVNTTTTTNITLHSVHIQTETVDTSAESVPRPQRSAHRSPRKRKARSSSAGGGRRPVAYFLPFESLSPVRLGRRVLREVVGPLQGGGHLMSAANREKLASYMAAVNGRPSTAPAASAPRSPQATTVKLSLQDALASKRSDFVRNTEARVRAMVAAREARLVRREKQSVWLEEVARRSPRSQRLAVPCYSPVAVPRLFSHRDMVGATRAKYLQLPEVEARKHDVKKSNRYKTNRLMKEIFSSQLQRKVGGLSNYMVILKSEAP